MTPSSCFQEKLTCMDTFIIIFLIAILIDLIDLMKLFKMMVEEYDGSLLIFIVSSLFAIIRTGFTYGLWMQKTDFMTPWMFVNHLVILYKGLNWMYHAIKYNNLERALFRIFFISDTYDDAMHCGINKIRSCNDSIKKCHL